MRRNSKKESQKKQDYLKQVSRYLKMVFANTTNILIDTSDLRVAEKLIHVMNVMTIKKLNMSRKWPNQ